MTHDISLKSKTRELSSIEPMEDTPYIYHNDPSELSNDLTDLMNPLLFPWSTMGLTKAYHIELNSISYHQHKCLALALRFSCRRRFLIWLQIKLAKSRCICKNVGRQDLKLFTYVGLGCRPHYTLKEKNFHSNSNIAISLKSNLLNFNSANYTIFKNLSMMAYIN